MLLKVVPEYFKGCFTLYKFLMHSQFSGVISLSGFIMWMKPADPDLWYRILKKKLSFCLQCPFRSNMVGIKEK